MFLPGLVPVSLPEHLPCFVLRHSVSTKVEYLGAILGIHFI